MQRIIDTLKEKLINYTDPFMLDKSMENKEVLAKLGSPICLNNMLSIKIDKNRLDIIDFDVQKYIVSSIFDKMIEQIYFLFFIKLDTNVITDYNIIDILKKDSGIFLNYMEYFRIENDIHKHFGVEITDDINIEHTDFSKIYEYESLFGHDFYINSKIKNLYVFNQNIYNKLYKLDKINIKIKNETIYIIFDLCIFTKIFASIKTYKINDRNRSKKVC